MSHKYYLDESGNSGDLVNKKRDLTFSSQPLFSLSSIEVKESKDTDKFIASIIKKYKIQQNELKSSSLYRRKPELFLEICEYITKNKLPFFLEVIDKKYFICTAIVNHLILPPYFTGDESDGQTQYFRGVIADYLSRRMTDNCYVSFFKLCESVSESTLKSAMDSIKGFILSNECGDDYKCVIKLVDESWDDYIQLKKIEGDAAISKFVPIPDINKKNNKVHLLPHVPCLTNIIARANLYHDRKLNGVSFIHDKQDHFDKLLHSIKEQLVNIQKTGNEPDTPNADFNIEVNPELFFENTVKAEKSAGIQIADLLAGFISRYFYDFVYLNSDINNIYHDIYIELRKSFNSATGVGINMVLPESYRETFENSLSQYAYNKAFKRN